MQVVTSLWLLPTWEFNLGNWGESAVAQKGWDACCPLQSHFVIRLERGRNLSFLPPPLLLKMKTGVCFITATGFQETENRFTGPVPTSAVFYFPPNLKVMSRRQLMFCTCFFLHHWKFPPCLFVLALIKVFYWALVSAKGNMIQDKGCVSSGFVSALGKQTRLSFVFFPQRESPK